MTDLTDEALDALVAELRLLGDRALYEPHKYHVAATAITALRAREAAIVAAALALEQELHDRAEKAEAERDAAMAGAVKVKPLVWPDFREGGTCGRPHHFQYFVTQDRHGRFWVHFDMSQHDNLDDAKRHCDRHYQRAAIQPDPDARQADLAKAAITALHDIDDIVANSEGVSGLHLNGDIAPWSEIMDGGAYGAWLQSVERLREAIRALLPPADLAAKIGGE